MRNRTSYEWDFEEQDESGDIVDHSFEDTAREAIKAGQGRRGVLVLVRDVGNDDDGVVDREWAYIEGGRLPDAFSAGSAVPKRFHRELERALK